jgi:hypothetical protein
MNALMTNALTNALHAGVLFIYFFLSYSKWLQGNKYFTGFIVSLFLVAFVLKVLGVLVHYYTGNPHVPTLWLTIAMLMILLNYFITCAIKMPDGIRAISIVISLFFIGSFIIQNHFFYIALSMIFSYGLAAFYSRNMTRFGFLSIVGANILWIILRKGGEFILQTPIPPEYRFDNDIYHILLIVSTFIIYKSIEKGNWSYP